MTSTNNTATIWTYEAGTYRASDLAQTHQAYFRPDGTLKWSQNMRAIKSPVPVELLDRWTAEAPAQILRLDAQRAAREERAAKLAGSIKATYAGTCALTGKPFRCGDAIKRFGRGWALALEMAPSAPVSRRERYEDTESLDGTGAMLDAERRNHERETIETMRRELAAEMDY